MVYIISFVIRLIFLCKNPRLEIENVLFTFFFKIITRLSSDAGLPRGVCRRPLIDAFHTEVLCKNPIKARVLCFVYHSRIVMRYFAAGGSWLVGDRRSISSGTSRTIFCRKVYGKQGIDSSPSAIRTWLYCRSSWWLWYWSCGYERLKCTKKKLHSKVMVFISYNCVA